MKKLLIAFAVATMTIAVNAAATNWSLAASNIVGTDNTGKYSGSGAITLFASEHGSGEWFSVDDMRNTKEVAGSTAVSPKISSTYAGTILATENSFYSDLFDVGTAYDFYITIEDGDKTFTSKKYENLSAQSASKAAIKLGSQAGQTWESVPEPTSGLLLLLGMAGLALRRRRA